VPTPAAEGQSRNRRNLFYEVLLKPSRIDEQVAGMHLWIVTHGYENSSGIIFAHATGESAALAGALEKRGLTTAFYHGKQAMGARLAAQERWTSGQVKTMVATCAFGMGIDKADVRFVIHHTMPKSIEEYCQEGGRAGRDGKATRVMLLFAQTDENRVKRLITEG
jgi:superfamily II DNA helicase RecQ